MLTARVGRGFSILAVGVAVVICASTANAAAPAPMGGDPKDPEGPVPAALLPTPPEIAGKAVSAWIASNPSADAGGVRILRDKKAVVVYWKGTPPTGLQKLAASQAIPVTFQAAAYSYAELEPIGKKLVTDHGDVVTSAGPSNDYSGVSVTLKTTAPPDTLAQLVADAGVPVVVDGVADAHDLACPLTPTGGTPARCGDRAPWFGGGLLRVRGTSGRVCSNGVALYAGPNEYMTMAAHCGASGTWVGYDSGVVMGTVNVALSHYKPNYDFMIVKADNLYRIWTGAWNTTTSRPVIGMAGSSSSNPRVAVGELVVVSGGVSGNGAAQEVESGGRFWSTDVAQTVGPGFHVKPLQDADGGFTGWVTRGDSGSPIIRSNSQGQFELQGFLSKGQLNTTDPTTCNPGRHPGFPPPGVYCYLDYYAMYADAAINSIGGLHLKTLSDPGAS